VTNLLHNQLDEASAKMLAEVAKQKGISLCGIQRDRTTADFSNKFLMPPDAILLASDLSQAAVTGGLTKISLAKNELGEEGTKAICEALEQNKTLKELDISGNRHGNIGGSAGAKHVAKMLGVNGGLTSLDLSNNALCGVTFMGGTYTAEGITAIAHALRVNGALKSIDLSGNQLCGIWTEGYGDQQGTYTAEGITAIADALRVNGGLTSIDLSNNQLCGVWTDYRGQHGTYTAEGITAIADALRVNGALTSVKLRGNKLGDEGWGAIFAAICGSKDSKIMSLDASGENIGLAGGKLIAKALGTSVTGALTSINLSDNKMCGVWTDLYGQHGTYTAEGITAIADAMRVNGGLTKISLARNNLEEEGTKAICEALEQNETLKELDISGNMYGSNIGGSAGVKHVAKMLGVNGGLTSINLSGNQLCGIWTDREGDQQGTYTAEGITAIADALRVNGGLTSIDLSGNQLCGIWTDGYCKQQGTYTAEGITAIADALRVNGALTALNLSSNCLKDEGVSAVCEAIQSNNETKLASLNFGDNNIGPVGANAVAAMVAVTGRLTSLDLSNNSLCGVNVYRGTYTAEGITAIADALRVNGALTSVKLWGNMLGDEGWGAIFAAICGNKDSKIVSMDGSSENIGPAGLMLIAKALHSSVTGALTSVDLSENHLTNCGRDMTGIAAIADALCVNGALTGCDLRSSKGGSYMGEEGEALIRSSVQGKARFELNL
jgi:Ran GTPase-activating protein (RanGAP) involved in mRNA processing and transport